MSWMDYAGVSVDIDADVLTGQIRNALQYGQYEREETECVELYVEENDDVIELGGGIGYLACYVDQRLSDEQTHVVVEPNSHLMELVERHREANDATFETVNAAYSTNGPLVEFPLPEEFWEASLQQDEPVDRTLYTGAVDLETLLKTFDLTDVVLVVDIEGGEVDLIENELDVIRSHCRALIVEFHHEDTPRSLAEDIQWAKGALDTSEFELVDEKGPVAVYRPLAE